MSRKLLVIFCALALIVCAALLIASVEKEDAQIAMNEKGFNTEYCVCDSALIIYKE